VQKIQIHDTKDNRLTIDLRDIPAAIGSRAVDAYWKIGDVADHSEHLDATGDGADQLERLAKSHERIGGAELIALAKGVCQIIWGEFRAYDDRLSNAPWVIIRAIDSSFYEVTTSDPRLIADIRAAFLDVRAS
jgi:hypothetical protein